jgi:putative nucleotidyltransferase with HDIG domain
MNSLKFKIVGLMTAIVVLIIAASGFISFEVQRSSMMAMAESSNAILTDTIRSTIANAMRSGQAHELGDILGRLRTRDVITALRIVDEEGRVLTSADSGEIGRVIAPPASYQQKIGDTVPLQHTESGTYQSLIPLHNSPPCHGCHSAGKEIIGYLHSELSLQQLDTLISRQKKSSFLSALTIIFLITVTISIFLATYVDRPLQRIVTAMQSVEKGDFAARTTITSSTEMRQLSENFNLMVDRLKGLMDTTIRHERDLGRAQEKLAHHREIHKMNQRLEGKVEEVEALNGSLEERIAELETAREQIAQLAGELETRNDSLQRAVSRLSTLYRVGLAINSTMDLNEVMSLIVRTAMRTLDAQIGYILLREQPDGRLKISTIFGHDLAQNGSIHQFPDASISSWVVTNRRPLLITDFDKTPEFRRHSSLGHERTSLVCAPLISQDTVMGTITVVNRNDDTRFNQEDLELLSTMAAQASIAIRNAQLYEEQQNTYISTIQALVSAVEASDSYIRGHSERVTRFSVALATRINLPPERIKLIERAGILHDIGKIGIDLNLLHKPGKLTEEEVATLHQHPAIGMKILEPITFLQDVRRCIGQHHERFDGTGYPFGLPGGEQMLEARILAIADAYDAMTTDRPYRQALSRQSALHELAANAGTQFDPELVPHFIELANQQRLELFNPGTLQYQQKIDAQGTFCAI